MWVLMRTLLCGCMVPPSPQLPVKDICPLVGWLTTASNLSFSLRLTAQSLSSIYFFFHSWRDSGVPVLRHHCDDSRPLLTLHCCGFLQRLCSGCVCGSPESPVAKLHSAAFVTSSEFACSCLSLSCWISFCIAVFCCLIFSVDFLISPHISSKAILLWTSSSVCSSSLLSTSCCWFMASRSALI